jgi:hypothetical protein
MYYLLAPLIIFSFYRKIKEFVLAVKQKNDDQIKINLLFLSLILIMRVFIVLAIEGVFTKV